MSGRLRPRLLTLIGVALLLALSGLSNAQETVTQTAAGQAQITATHVIPYSAQEIRQITETAADGTQTTHKTLTKIFRDSEGRIRSELYTSETNSPQAGNESLRSIDIIDPVAGVRYIVNPRNHTAHLMRLTPQVPALAQKLSSPTAASADRPTATNEDLGQQEIEGVNTSGHRTFTTIPAGAQGNDRPIVISDEVWFSPELQQVVFEDRQDPLHGEMILRFGCVAREEPSPDLFQVPADYTITEEQPVRAGIAPPEEPELNHP